MASRHPAGLLPVMTSRLALRRLEETDTPSIFRMSQERGMADWLSDQVYRDEAHAAEVVAYLMAQYARPDIPRHGPLVMAVSLLEGGEAIGHVGLSPSRDAVEIGYAIAEAHQGRGLATEAVRAASEWGLTTLGLPHIYGIVASDNLGSRIVLERAGFTLQKEAMKPMHGAKRLVRTYALRR